MSDVIDRIDRLPVNWHAAGPVVTDVLRALERHATSVAPIRYSVETGCGKTTLLLSHLSPRHLVFTMGNDDSHAKVVASPLLKGESVEWILGPTQRTIAGYAFRQPIDLAVLDGPHGYPFPQIEYWAVYPHLRAGALLVVDDIQIPTIYQLYRFLQEDEMFSLREVVRTTAFFTRTDAPTFDPCGDGWWVQRYNTKRAPITDWDTDLRRPMRREVRKYVPRPLKNLLRRAMRAR